MARPLLFIAIALAGVSLALSRGLATRQVDSIAREGSTTQVSVGAASSGDHPGAILAEPQDSPEAPSDRLLREVAEYIEDQDAAPLRILGGIQEDPDLGFYASREELLADASRLCLTFLPKDQEWLREQVGWSVNGCSPLLRWITLPGAR